MHTLLNLRARRFLGFYSHPLTLSFGCRTRKRHPCKGLAYLNVRAPPSCPTRKSAIFPRGPRVGAFDAVMRQSTPQEKSKIFLVGTPNTRTDFPLPDALIWMQNAKAPLTNEGFSLVFRGVKMSERTDSFACKTRSERAPPHFHAAIRNSGCDKQGTAANSAVPVIYHPL